IGDKTGLIDGMNITGMVNLDGAINPYVPNDEIVSADGKYNIFLVKEQEEEQHDHIEGESHDHSSEKGTHFEKIEVMKGATELGYTAITPVNEIAEGTHVAVKGAFFVNAKLSNTGGHEH